ncbi:DUF3450 family protein [Synoicihabitans lomoniglobus]|uniref:DUF3450 family protein n=1 Tax=Synoicihabitans lomoniglobus TaxID=2909285 RepID=A0AAE9ZWX7_9BACT|nr:DUF3450 domain-containing protein [Opitutaceae bacterium LMO-M01]WED64028.1 DUF3450 family protein [Opitutaceae bacterium LMO-M01]
MPASFPRLPRGVFVHCALVAALASSSLADTPLNDVQAAASEWARLRSETSRLETEWVAEREVLAASISGLSVQANQLEIERDTLLAQSKTARDEIAQMTADNVALAARIDRAGVNVDALARRLLALRPALPPRLSAALDLPFRSLAGEGLAAAERMRHTMTILNRCNQFNQTFVLSEEILTVTPGSEPRLLEVLYWGLAQACALDRSGGETFMGRPVNGAWTWEPAPDFAGQAARLIDIHQDTIEPAFVMLPAQIMGGDQ